MQDLGNSLMRSLRDPEYSESYAETFLDMFVATQIKVLREQRDLTQADLGELIGTNQAGISRLENVNYSGWSGKTLKKLARALRVRLRISFEAYGSLPHEVVSFNRNSLERVARERDLLIFPENHTESRSSVTNIDEYRLSHKAAKALAGAMVNNGSIPIENNPTRNEVGGYAAASSANG